MKIRLSFLSFSNHLLHLCSCPSWRWSNNHFWTTRWCSNISISIRIGSKSGFPADFPSSQKPVICGTFPISVDSNNPKLFCFFKFKLSLRIVKSLGSSDSTCLFRLLSFFLRDSLFICPTRHSVFSLNKFKKEMKIQIFLILN